MKILCFGAAREIVSAASFNLDLPAGTTVAGLRKEILDTYPAFGELVSFAIARNASYALPEEIIELEDELVIIPPVSGG